MASELSQTELEAYLDEALPPDEMAAIEEALRTDKRLQKMLADITGRRDAGVHSIGAIWRRHRLTCPTREQLGSFLLGVLPDDFAGYVTFHLEVIGCRVCNANRRDLEAQQATDEGEQQTRRRKYFESSVGRLRPGE